MLNSFSSFQRVAVFGGKSDLALSIIKDLPLGLDSEIILIGRALERDSHLGLQKTSEVTTMEVDFKDINRAQEIVNQIFSVGDVDLAIFAYALLPAEDAQIEENVLSEVFLVNTFTQAILLNSVATAMRRQKHGQILHISTVAAVRPRKRNFVYGASKTSIDFFARGLQRVCSLDNVFLTILRPGFVQTKMTSGLSPAPFATTKSHVAMAATRALKKRKKIAYSPRYLGVVVGVIRILPERIFRLIDK